jgi:hypothetical protein
MTLTPSERLLFQKVAEDAIEEAYERQVEISVADVTVRLLCAYEQGIRDEGELKVLYNELHRQIPTACSSAIATPLSLL